VPEGDTIYRAATALSKAIGGAIVLAASSPLAALTRRAEGLVGLRIEGVEAHGKHLLIRFEGGLALHSHMKMTGSWHIYRPGEAWQRPERQAHFVIETANYVAVCFNAPVIDLVRTGGAAGATPDTRPPPIAMPFGSRGPGTAADLARLGPDLLKRDFDKAEAERRLRARADTPIGEALLDQTAIAGIGNIYKSETLFACRVDPFMTIGALPDEALDRVVEKARELMSQNLGAGPRATRLVQGPGSRYWVYRRSGEPCFVCGAPIRMQRQGVTGRSTYFCPQCQRVGAGAPSRASKTSPSRR
jgi:endonuclease-8